MDIEAIYQKGFSLRCEGRYSEAGIEFQRVLSIDPGHINAKHQQALIAGFLGHFDGSLAALENLSKSAPRNLDIIYDLAMTQMMLGLQDEACANFKKILTLDPSHQKAKQQSVYC